MGNLDQLREQYEQELSALDRLGKQFAHRYPQIAERVGVRSDGSHDPNVTRLIQSCAMLNARTAMRIERSETQFAEVLLGATYPHYMRPFPSSSIARFDTSTAAGRMIQSSSSVARGTMLYSHEEAGVSCAFRTVYDTVVAPVCLPRVAFEPAIHHPMAIRPDPGVSACISISIKSTSATSDLGQLNLQRLRVFLDAEPSMCGVLRDALLVRAVQAWLEVEPGRWIPIDPLPVNAVGFAEDEAMIPMDGRTHPAYRILTEYFCFPEKFNFFDIDLAAFASVLPEGCKEVTLHLGLADIRFDSDAARMLSSLSIEHLLIGCTPIVNLFRKPACPISLDYTKTEYQLLPDASRPSTYDIYSVDSVAVVRDSPGASVVTPFYPYYSLKHGSDNGRRGHYWALRRDGVTADLNPGHEHFLSLVDIDFDPLTIDIANVSIDLTCTNRDLPSLLTFGALAGDLTMANSLGGIPVRMLRRPTRPYRFSHKDRWRLVSHLSLDHSSLASGDLDAMRELLALYDLPQSPLTQRQIAGLKAISQKPARVRWQEDGCAGYLHGLEVQLAIDQQAFVGSGLLAFAQVLDHFFGLFVHLNSFVQLIFVCHTSGKEILRCQPRNGDLRFL